MCFTCWLAFPAFGQEVIAGYDLLKTQQGQTQEDLSGLSGLCPGVQVVGDPIIPLRGIPLDDSERPPCAVGKDIGETDTFIQRLNSTVGLNGGFAGVPIEIVSLHLQSVQPFQVNNNGSMERWTLDVTLQPSQPIGSMQIQRSSPTGGTFFSNLPVQPLLTFTRVAPCPAVEMCSVAGPLIQFNANGVPWSYTPTSATHTVPGCTTNFYPGISTSPGLGEQSVLAAFSEQASLIAHGVIPPPPPTMTQRNCQLAAHYDFTVINRSTQPINDFHILNARFVRRVPRGALPDTTIYIKSTSIADSTPFCPLTVPTMWTRVDLRTLSPTYRRIANWRFPTVPPGASAPAMDIVFSLPCDVNVCAEGTAYEVTYRTTFNCAIVDTGTFRFSCPYQVQPCNPTGCSPNVAVEPRPTGGKTGILLNNSPNPFSPTTTIDFRMAHSGPVTLRVFDALGRHVRTLLDEHRQAGHWSVVWDGRDSGGRPVAAGAYFYEIQLANERQAKRMILIR